jgi:hypothetical protein
VPAALKEISRYQSLINYNDLVAVEIERMGALPSIRKDQLGQLRAGGVRYTSRCTPTTVYLVRNSFIEGCKVEG